MMPWIWCINSICKPTLDISIHNVFQNFYTLKFAFISIIPWELIFCLCALWNLMSSFICLQIDTLYCWHYFLEELFFLHWFCFTSFSEISCFYLWMPISVFSILLHCLECLLFQSYLWFPHNLEIWQVFQISSQSVLGCFTYYFAFSYVF